MTKLSRTAQKVALPWMYLYIFIHLLSLNLLLSFKRRRFRGASLTAKNMFPKIEINTL